MPAGRLTRVRLQKFLSDTGVASRRRAEELIRDGHVLVNDAVVDTLPAFVDPTADSVIVDGVPVRPQKLEYFIVNKPKGVVCTGHNPGGRVRVVDLLPELPVRLSPVGRLDEESTGLLLLTNDGDLAQHLTHPRRGPFQTYHAEVRGRVPDDLPVRMRTGIYLAEGRAQAKHVEILHSSTERSTLLITLREDRSRQVRRMLARLGYPVRKLKRVAIGPVLLHKLPVGAARRLSLKELRALRDELARAGRPAPRRRRKHGAAADRESSAPRGSPGPRRPGQSVPARRLIT